MASPPGSRRRRLPPEQREKQVLDAAVRVFSRSGFHDASMDAVAEQAGVSKPMVYTHGGGSKEELLRRCIRRESERLLGSVSDAAGGPAADAEERLRRGLRAFFTTVTTHRDGWAVLYRQARTGVFADEVHEARSRIVGRIAELLAAELAIPAGADPAAVAGPVAAALTGAAEGLADWAGTAGIPGAEDPDALAETLTTLIWPGLERIRDTLT
ncbi:transcriptional regulator, TetR family [Pseudonocardia sp. Ae168_Ps1]|uniref:TetR/AcrR family transcriptional regulator n=1 Tax=unclassified Pseudonocardia TaxID=2619320 RepID=UPI000968C160|nr:MULTISPECIES: TetR/AcrR family transcriptional regulator [unclassified Pseudonocardia]OLL75085.1 transcriptional regulator, TetR family [Pseudonocardia sp. Ae150A_Ps1]OLL81080.1 transcriptional regulator, TetR family [Pseudonocardia sp. Ae168_Ps1]OLL84805.1 transcriptional regulator, TetR family [Pseudonocardia sp. Ae263_Ps1]OLL95178.1 transcriptional regulator, TetR family [Pseudonocardia sp. Ae356_Ps1]